MKTPMIMAALGLALFAAPSMFAQDSGAAPEGEAAPAAESPEMGGEESPESGAENMEAAEGETSTDAPAAAPAKGKIKGAGIGWTFLVDDKDYVTLKVNGSFRGRGEVRSPNRHGAGETDRGDSRFLLRSRLAFELNLPSASNFLFEIQDSRQAGEENFGGSSAGSGVDVLQANFFTHNLLNTGVSAYAGRQRFNIGDQRVWGVSDFGNTGRAWDGVRFAGESGTMPWRLFWFNEADTLGAGRKENHTIGATIANTSMEGHEQELLVLASRRSTGFEERLFTASLRLAGRMDGFGYSAEGVVQMGETSEFGLTAAGERMDIMAYAAGIALDYVVDMGDSDFLKLGAGWDFASGGTLSNNEVNTYRSPYITGHKFTGEGDIVGYRNIHDFWGKVSYSMGSVEVMDGASAEDITIGAAIHSMFRHHSVDGYYAVDGSMLRTGNSNDAKHIGNELDIMLSAKVNKYVSFSLVYAYFMAGQGWEDSAARGQGINDDVQYAYATLQVSF